MKFKKLETDLYMDKICLILIILLVFGSNFVSAENATINNNPITIKIYNNSIEVISKYQINNKNFTLNVQTTNISINNQSFISGFSIPYQEFTLDNYFIQNATQIIDLSINERLINCEIERAKNNFSWTSCLNDCGDISNLRNNLYSCNVSMISKESEIQRLNTEATTLKTSTDSTKNEKYLWGVVGIILGIVGYLLYKGKIGGRSVKDKALEEMNRETAG